jgi:autotransporter-associated beta strand protein
MQSLPPKQLGRAGESRALFLTWQKEFDKRAIAALAKAVLPAAMLLLCIATGYAGGATWNSNPASGNWNSAGNWTPMTVPNGPNDTATFQSSNQVFLSLSANTEVSAIIFNPTSTGNFTFTIQPSVTLTISGAGITNNSGFSEAINASNGGGDIAFTNAATAGDHIFFAATVTFSDSSSAGASSFFYPTIFHDSSTAGNATFSNFSAHFHDSSTAGNAQIQSATFAESSTAGTATIGTSVAIGSAAFAQSSNAGSASITGGATFTGNSTAMTATLRAINGASIVFSGDATGDMAHVTILDNGKLDISGHNAPGVTIGSLDGEANVALGANRLTIGTNNTDTTFSGHLTDNSAGGSLAKVGTGTLILTNSNSYLGTTISQGTLRATHDGAFGATAQSGPYVSVEASGILTLDSGATNNYISDKASLKVVTGSTVNLNFAGTADEVRSLMVNGISQPPGIYGGMISGAPNQLPQFAGTGTVIATTKAVSRKVHGAAGTFDIDLPLTGTPGIECRSGGANKDYQIVVTFFSNVTMRTATVISGSGSVSSRSGDGTNTVTINLSNVANAQTINVALVDVNDGTSTTTFVVPMSILVGDITGNGAVNGTDVTAAKHTSQAVDASSFRADVIANGVLNSSDVSTVKFNSGTALP